MAQVIYFPLESVKLKSARTSARLSLTQAVTALEVTLGIAIAPGTLEAWENGRPPKVCPKRAAIAYKGLARHTAKFRHLGTNVLFGSLPLSVARDILDMSVEEIAALYGYKRSFWIKFEANARAVPVDIIEDLQSKLQGRFAVLCG